MSLHIFSSQLCLGPWILLWCGNKLYLQPAVTAVSCVDRVAFIDLAAAKRILYLPAGMIRVAVQQDIHAI